MESKRFHKFISIIEAKLFTTQGQIFLWHIVTPAARLLALFISGIKLSNNMRNGHDHDPAFWL